MCPVEYIPIPAVTNNHQEFYNETKEEIQFQIYGLQQCYKKKIAYHLLGILLFGVPYFICYMVPKFKTFQYKYCDLDNATILLGNVRLIYIVLNILCNFVNIRYLGDWINLIL